MSLQHKCSFPLILLQSKSAGGPRKNYQMKEKQIPTTQPFIKQCMILAEEEHRKQLNKITVGPMHITHFLPSLPKTVLWIRNSKKEIKRTPDLQSIYNVQ
jgi:hypothetical protein